MDKSDSKHWLHRIASVRISIAAVVGCLLTLFPAVRAQSLDGYWQSDGYGLLVEIRDAKMSVSQITAISCLPWWTAKRSDVGGNKNQVVFNRGDAFVYLSPGSSSDTLRSQFASWRRRGSHAKRSAPSQYRHK
jgi:hypothetical protein